MRISGHSILQVGTTGETSETNDEKRIATETQNAQRPSARDPRRGVPFSKG